MTPSAPSARNPVVVRARHFPVVAVIKCWTGLHEGIEVRHQVGSMGYVATGVPSRDYSDSCVKKWPIATLFGLVPTRASGRRRSDVAATRQIRLLNETAIPAVRRNQTNHAAPQRGSVEFGRVGATPTRTRTPGESIATARNSAAQWGLYGRACVPNRATMRANALGDSATSVLGARSTDGGARR
jgi:hypothetical protein